MESSKHDFKWFGEGFDGFPRHLPEDCVQYSLYIIDPTAKDGEIQSQLRVIQEAAAQFTEELLKDFLWQRQGFNLHLLREKDLSFLRGQTNYGDSVGDEWLIVYILCELSKRFPNLWTRIVDNDGEFLLIEAANVLPQWITPELANFRLWLNQGKLFIIPHQSSSETYFKNGLPSQVISIHHALAFIHEKRSELLHLPLVEAEAFFRLKNYPEEIQNSLHTTRALIPRKLAFITHKRASYVSAAVEAFYLRDPISMRTLQGDNRSKLIFPPTDLIAASVKFTKISYAQIRGQQFKSPPNWTSHFTADNGASHQRKIEVGMKLTCGFELLLADPQNTDEQSVREITSLLEDLDSGKEHLPSNADILGWDDTDDNENWLDIEFETLDDELGKKNPEKRSEKSQGFRDKNLQENLRKMVSRFEDFLNEESGSGDDIEVLDDIQSDGDESSTDSSTDSEEDKSISLDENEFTSMMREMMGMPSSVKTHNSSATSGEGNNVYAVKTNEDDQFGRVVQAMEAELQDAGALDILSKPSSNKAIQPGRSTNSDSGSAAASDRDVDDIDIDYNIAKNILESLRSQNGAAGPGGNLMAIMDMLPSRPERHGH